MPKADEGKRRRVLLIAAAIALAFIVAVIAISRSAAVFGHPLVFLSLVREPAPNHLPVPVQGVRPRQLQDTWGAARSGGRRHQGIDIFARRHTPVISATRGIVVTVGENELGGRMVRVFGPGGQWHYYAHLESFGPIRSGDVIPAGQLLGTVGDSGNARGTPPHLHYGVYRRYGGAINPYPLLVW